MEVLLLFFLFLVAISLFQWITKRKHVLSTFERLGIPGPKPSFWTGNMKEFLQHPNELELMQKYGRIFGVYFGLIPTLIISDPELLKIIQVKEAQIFHRRKVLISNAAVPENIFGSSQVLIHGPVWKQSRDTTTPAYTTSKMKLITDKMNQVLDDHLSELATRVKKDQPVDMTQVVNRLSADITFQTQFGAKVSRSNEKEFEHLVGSLYLAFPTNFLNPINFLSTCFPELQSKLYFCRQVADKIRYAWNMTSAKYVSVLCDKIVKTRLALEKQNQFSDVLQIMINKIYPSGPKEKPKVNEEYEEQLDYSNLLGNSYYIAVASQETVRSAILYALFYLAKDRKVQEKLREEILHFSGKDEDMSYMKYNEMKYLDNVYSETLRLQPPVPTFVTRIAEKDYKYKDILIPKEMGIYAPQMGMHRDPEYWSDPDEFIPERFEDKSSIDPYIYQPFGIGPRHCTGMRFAQLMGKLTVARFVKSFDLKLVEDELEADFGYVILRPKKTLYLKLTPI